MNYCMNCGREYDGAPGYCPECAAMYQQAPQYQQPPVQNVYVQAPYPPAEVDAPNIGFAILSFFIPLVGLILFLVWKDKTPLKAKSCGKGALIRVIVDIVSSVVAVIIYVVMLGGLFALELGMY